MNAAVRLYADAANAKTKLENGFDLTDYDEPYLGFCQGLLQPAAGYRRQSRYDRDARCSLETCSVSISVRKK
ncbi:MAG: hypothetical protein ACLVEU_18640 [Bacteroides cellulosilyticus]